MSAVLKLAAWLGAGFAAYEGYLWWRKKNSFTVMNAGHGYTVVLDYTGAGLGGPLAASDIQGYLGPAFTVSSTSTDPAKKTITYNVLMNSTINGTQAVLAPSAFPSAYGSLSVALVQMVQ